MAKGEDPIVLFSGGSDGYGDAINVGRDSYAWTYNFDCRSGRAVPSTAQTRLGTIPGAPYTAAFEWESTANLPFLLLAEGTGTSTARVAKIEDDSSTSASQSIDPYTDGILFKYDKDATTDPDEEMAWFCNGQSNDAFVRRKKDATFSSAGHDAKADVLGVVASDFYRGKGYLFSKLTADTDPGTDSNWGVGIPVGRPTYAINKILPLGGSPIVCKGDGVFKYNPAPSTAIFDNLTPYITPHPDNGKNAFTDGRGRIYYDTEDGHILVITFGAQSLQTPTRLNWVDRDTPWGRISAMTADMEDIYAAVEPGRVKTQQLGITVQSDDGGVFTNHTGNVTDQKYSTLADWTALTSGGSDFIYIGADEPFWGMQFDLVGTRTGNNPPISAKSFSDGGGGWTDIHLTSFDSTYGFMRSGFINLKNAADDTATDFFASAAWGKNTVNSISKYWIRLTVGAAMTGVTAREVSICPYRPPLDVDLFAISGPMLAGALPKILVGQWRGESIVWHDVWTLDCSTIDQLMVSRTTMANSQGPRTLFALTGLPTNGLRYIPVGIEANPLRAAWPLTNGTPHLIGFSGHAFGAPSHVKKVRKLSIYGEYLQDDDDLRVYWRWDNSDRWEKSDSHTKFPVVVEDLAGEGRVLYVAVALSDGSRDAVAPYISWAEVPEGEWEDLGPLAESIGADIASPQTY